jgi:hypothetical protein
MARIPDAARASAKKQRRKDADPKTEDPKTDEPKPEQGSGNPNLKELLKGAPLSYQPFPVDALPEPLRSLTIDGAEAIGIDTSYIALPGLVHAAGLVNAARKVIVKPGWLEPCTLWGVTVGSSATGKTQGFKLSHDIAARLHMEFKGLKRDVCVTNVNIASVKKVLKQNPMGTLVSKDELSSFLAMVSKRATGRLAEDIGDWCEMDQAGTLINRRILDSDANIDQTNVCCSIVGTIQPQILFAVTRGQMTDAGVTFRFQFAAPPRKPRVIDRYAVIPDRVTNAWEKCFRKLLKLSGEHHVPLDDEATELFWGDEGYLKRMSDRGATPHSDTHAAAYGKLEGRCARYALVDYLIGCDPGEDGRGPIPGESMRRAIELCEWFAHEDDRLLSMRDENDFDRRLRFIVDRIELRYKGRITLRDLQLLEHLKSASHSLDLAKAICDAGYGTIEVGDRKDSQVLVIRSADQISEPAPTPALIAAAGLDIWVDRRGHWQQAIPHPRRHLLLTKHSKIRIPVQDAKVRLIFTADRAPGLPDLRQWLNDAGFHDILEVPLESGD